jgi:hypothetical protein
LNPGDGISIKLSGSASTFNWTVAGSDVQKIESFTSNVSKANNNWLSLPYTTVYKTASDIVTDIEGGIGSGKDQKVESITRWRADMQNVVSYSYSTMLNKWTGTNFTLNPGDGISIKLSGTTDSFDWSQPLVINPYK